MSDKATVIPPAECGLMINVGSDGVWMHFNSDEGYTSINVNNWAEKDGGFIRKVLLAWCAERVVQANKILEKGDE